MAKDVPQRYKELVRAGKPPRDAFLQAHNEATAAVERREQECRDRQSK